MIAITGAAGFIGSALAWHCNQAGRHDLLLVDDLGRDARFRNLCGLDFDDYLDKDEFLARIENGRPLPELEAVFHLGACSSTLETDAGYLMRNNFAYSKAVAQWCLARGVRLIYASSAATYGDGAQGHADHLASLPRLQPLNAYALSKHAFDLWAWRAGALESAVGLKYFNVFGPNEYHKGEMRSMALRAFEEIQAGGPVRLFRSDRPDFADGEQRRDFIYVKDAVEMTWHLAESGATGLFNVGSGSAHTWLQLVRPIFNALELPERIEFVEMPPALRGKYQYYTRARIARLYATGYNRGITPLRDAVTDYVVNYLVPQRPLELSDAPVAAPLNAVS